ncbi:hypothetical protein VaNZ11_005584 [Volvox africanus]|uniref:EGF-like domain-containing protein n=1 Tax=Volvox africanus TaxID=51714 RepID=A0ABQ5RZB1_9CHLO|nr:hypothetical protein VaNZ11_005584 [Volvox africanus]
MWHDKDLLLLVLSSALVLGMLVTVRSCGHHVVHRQIKDLAAYHSMTQQLHIEGGLCSRGEGKQTATPHTATAAAATAAATAAREGRKKRGNGPPYTHTHAHAHAYDGVRVRQAEVTAAAVVAELEHQEGDLTSGADGGDRRHGCGDESGSNDQQMWDHLLPVRGRSLQQAAGPPVSPAPIRLSVTYQQLGALDASQQQRLTRVVEAVRRVLQKFVRVKWPARGGLLVDPYCDPSFQACYPDFIAGRSQNRECGLASILREHIINPLNCTSYITKEQRQALIRSATGPVSGAGGGASIYGKGCASFAGSKGDDTDMYFYITAVHNNDCNLGAAAWAKPCLLDLGNNRPLLAAANVCPRALETLLDEEQLTAVLTHEMIHALGFTDSMYNLTRRADGTARPLSELLQPSNVGGKQVQVLVSPSVRDAARAHFACPSLSGAQLEEEGSAGSAGSHWEYTHYQGEVMVASTTFAADGTPPVLSNLTLSYLDDTGWYVTNRSAAGLLSWGAGAGCLLPSSTCSSYMLAVPGQRLFCGAATSASASQQLPAPASTSSTFVCTKSYRARGTCRALNFTNGCGLVLSRNAKETCLTSDAPDDLPAVFGWSLGTPSGRCFQVVYRFQAVIGYNRYTYPSTGQDGDSGAACFETVCSANGSKVFVKILGQQLECPAGRYLNLAQLLPSRFSAGRIGPCPPAQDLCSTQSCPASACNPTGGECLNGSCYCRLAYTGADCGFSLVTGQEVTDSSADDSSAGGGGSPSLSPPPWVQLVQLTLWLTNPVSDVGARQGQFQAAIASWADLNIKAVAVVSVNSGVPVVPPAATAAAGAANDTVVGDVFDATAGSHRRRGLHQASSLQPNLLPVAASVATVRISPSKSRPAALLLGWLRSNATSRNRLSSQLSAAGFQLIQQGIRWEYLITQQSVDSSSTASSGPGPAEAVIIGRGRKVMSVSLAAGAAAVVGIISAIVTARVRHTCALRKAESDDTSASAGEESNIAADGGVRGGGGGDGFVGHDDGGDNAVGDGGGGGPPPSPSPSGIGRSRLSTSGRGAGLARSSVNSFVDAEVGPLAAASQQHSFTRGASLGNSTYSTRITSSQPPPSQPPPSQPPPPQSVTPYSYSPGLMGKLSPLYSEPEEMSYS